MDLTFYKLRLSDSDIILVDDLAGDGRDRDWVAAARSLLHRRRGAGADRLAVIAKPEADLWLRVFLADGGESPCADAALCAARFLLDSGRSGSEAVPIRISGGELRVDVLDSASLGIYFGTAEGHTRRRPHKRGGRGFPYDEHRGGGRTLSGSAAARGHPRRRRRGGILRRRRRAGEGSHRRIARIRVAQTRDARRRGPSGLVTVRVASRGQLLISAPSGGALDCCASAAAALAASAAVGYTEREAMVRLGSGSLWVEWAEAGSLYVATRPEYVYRGEYHLND